MNKIFSQGLGILSIAVMAVACQPEDFDSPFEAGVPLLSDYADKIRIDVDQTTNTVTFNLDAKAVTPVWIKDGKVYSTVNGLSEIYAKAGDYSIDVKVANACGVSDGLTRRTFHLDNTVMNFDKYVTLLSGGDGQTKQWRMAASEKAHLACGEPGSDGTNWWAASVNEKADYGLYDDVLTFGGDMSYVYDPGEGGTVYVNKGASCLADKKDPADQPDTDDYMAAVDAQTASYAFDVDGDDLYLVLPNNTLFPYIAYDEQFASPRYKIVSCTAKKLVLLVDNGDIAWQFILTSAATEEPSVDVPTTGIVWHTDDELNLWSSATFTNEYYYAPGWSQIADPELIVADGVYTWSFPEATSDQWQNQVKFHTSLSASAADKYYFSLTLNSSTALTGATIKLTEDGDDNNFFFAERVNLEAYEDFVFEKADLDGLDMGKVMLVLDFGGNAPDTEITLSDVKFKVY